MCVVSMVGDFYNDRWKDDFPPKRSFPSFPGTFVLQYATQNELNDLREMLKEHMEAFSALKKEVEDCKELLMRAKKYDVDNNEPDCEIEDKVALIKKVAELVGVNMNDVFGK